MVEQSNNYSSLAQQNTPTVQATNDRNDNSYTGAVKSFLAVLWLFKLTEGKELPHQEGRTFFLE